MDILQNLGGFRIHAVEENATGAVIGGINQCTLHIGHRMICAVKKIQYTLGQ